MSIPLHASTLRQLNSFGVNPEDVLVCQWVGHGLSGRVISLLKQCSGVYLKISHDITKPETKPETKRLDLTPYVTEYSEEEREYTYDRYVSSQIPFAYEIIHKWDTSSGVSLLKKQDESLIWRITSGKVHTLVESHFKIICLFPLANPNYSFNAEWIRPSEERLDFESAVQVPWMLEKVAQDPSFFRGHSIKSISEQYGTTVLEFSADYPRVLSKFDRDLFITPYEWGVTLISYTEDSSQLSGPIDINGHSAIVIERIVDGVYHSDMCHIVRWTRSGNGKIFHHHNIDYGPKAAKLKKEESSYEVTDPKNPNKRIRKILKDENINYAKECFGSSLHHSPTWIRRKENVSNMLRQVEELYALQERSQAPVFYFYDTGNNYTFYDNMKSSTFIGAAAVATGITKELTWPYLLAIAGTVYLRNKDKSQKEEYYYKIPNPPNGENVTPEEYKNWAVEVQKFSDHEINRHNCASFALKMLEQADITIDQGSLKKHLAQLPKDYASSRIETTDLKPYELSIWERRVGAQKEVAASAVKEMLFGLAIEKNGTPLTRPLKRRSLFIKNGPRIGKAKEEFVQFIDEKFLTPENRKLVKDNAFESLSKGLKWGELHRVELDKQEVVNFVYPLMDFLLDDHMISRKLEVLLSSNKIHIPIKAEEEWKEKEECLISPKTYEQTLQTIISNLLKLEICDKILWSFKFSRSEEQGGSFVHLIRSTSYLKVI